MTYLSPPMMSNKCYYAVRAMLELGKHEGEGPLTIGAIAAAQDIPVRFLEAILRQLKQAGLTDSHRGKDGGYMLARPAKQISVGEVTRLFESQRAANGEAARAGVDAKAVLDLNLRAEEAQAAVYAATTIDELVRDVRDRQARYVVDFSI